MAKASDCQAKGLAFHGAGERRVLNVGCVRHLFHVAKMVWCSSPAVLLERRFQGFGAIDMEGATEPLSLSPQWTQRCGEASTTCGLKSGANYHWPSRTLSSCDLSIRPRGSSLGMARDMTAPQGSAWDLSRLAEVGFRRPCLGMHHVFMALHQTRLLCHALKP